MNKMWKLIDILGKQGLAQGTFPQHHQMVVN